MDHIERIRQDVHYEIAISAVSGGIFTSERLDLGGIPVLWMLLVSQADERGEIVALWAVDSRNVVFLGKV